MPLRQDFKFDLASSVIVGFIHDWPVMLMQATTRSQLPYNDSDNSDGTSRADVVDS